MTVSLEIQGFDEVIDLLDGVDVPSQMNAVVERTTSGMARFAAILTPVATGAMRDAWRGKTRGMYGTVYIFPAAINPRSGAPVTSYAAEVEERVGILDATMVMGDRMAATALENVKWEPR